MAFTKSLSVFARCLSNNAGGREKRRNRHNPPFLKFCLASSLEALRQTMPGGPDRDGRDCGASSRGYIEQKVKATLSGEHSN